MARNRKDQPTDSAFYHAAFRWMGVGFEFCLVIGFFVLIGYWLDKVEDTSPGWMILGFFIGFGVMMYIIVKRAKMTEKEFDEKRDPGEDDDVV
jgi:F0F1-type ATP synthase assembly protein I